MIFKFFTMFLQRQPAIAWRLYPFLIQPLPPLPPVPWPRPPNGSPEAIERIRAARRLEIHYSHNFAFLNEMMTFKKLLVGFSYFLFSSSSYPSPLSFFFLVLLLVVVLVVLLLLPPPPPPSPLVSFLSFSVCFVLSISPISAFIHCYSNRLFSLLFISYSLDCVLSFTPLPSSFS